MGFIGAPTADPMLEEQRQQALDDQALHDLLLMNMFNDQGGATTTSIERTEFGIHIDNTNAFYASLSPEQQDAFVSPLAQGQDLADFEASLSPEALDRWQDLKDDSHTLGVWHNPENESELELAASGLRTMMDNYPSSDPASKLVQDQMIEKLGGEDAVLDLIQQSMTPGLGAEGLPPEAQEILLDAQNDTYSFTLETDENGHQAIVEGFFNGEPIELVGTADGGVELQDTSNDPVINDPTLNNDANVDLAIPKGP